MNACVVWLALAMSGFLLMSCNQSGSGSHMMSGGMMGGGMIGGMMSQPSSEGADDRALPEVQSEAAQLYRQYCGQCHALAAPSVHTASEWPGVVARMKQHIMTLGKAMPEDDEMQEILDYLQRYAG